jgi:hypothetical protein
MFEELEGATFTVVATGVPGAVDRPFGPIDLELTGVKDLSRESIDAFSVLFRGPREQEFAQANYRLRHAELGDVDLFLVPILDPRPQDERVLYQSIVSRFVED